MRRPQGVRQGCPLSPTLFNFFVDELVKEIKNSKLGVKIQGLDLEALLYADDVVLLADSVEDLQGLIDIVDRFCRKWRMEINLKKSEVMVVRAYPWRCAACARRADDAAYAARCEERETDDAANAARCVLCSPWECRGRALNVVRKYKYLGVWFSEDLKWDEHIDAIVAKASNRTETLSRVLRNSRLPARAKTLVWLAQVRPLLEYGCEIWSANTSQLKRLESIQQAAGKTLFRLNAKTNRHAVRALMGVPPIHFRHEQARLKYIVKVLMMCKSRLARQVIVLPPAPALPGRGRLTHWWPDMMEFVEAHEVLAQAYGQLDEAAARNQGVVPHGADPNSMSSDTEYFPAKAWKDAVVRWTQERTATHLRADRGGATLTLLRRAMSDDDVKVPRFPLTKRANHGPDQIRLRLLAGTSALNRTMCKWDSTRTQLCPFDSCAEPGAEDAIHLLTRCRGLDAPRGKFHSELQSCCTCDRRIGSGGAIGCAEFFDELDDAGKALFMLGGPVDGRTPEANIDACAREFVRLAWESRSAALDAKAENPMILDLTRARKPNRKAGKGKHPSILSFFSPISRAAEAHAAETVEGNRYTRAHPQRLVGNQSQSDRRTGSGLNGETAMRRS